MFSLLSLTLLALAAPVPVLKAPEGPHPAPRIEVAQLDKDGKPVLICTITRYQAVQKEVTVNVGGRVEKRITTEMVPVTTRQMVLIDAKAFQVAGADGKRVELAELRKRLSSPVAVFVSADGKPIDPFYLKLLRDGSLYVVHPDLPTVVNSPPVERLPQPLPKPRP